jgi:hypothetical protein
MSQFIQHPASSIKLSFAARRAAWMVSLVVLAVVAAVAVVLLVNHSSDSSSATPASNSGVSYYGGHEEGSAGIGRPTGNATAARPFSGGGFTDRYQNNRPEEGTAGR